MKPTLLLSVALAASLLLPARGSAQSDQEAAVYAARIALQDELKRSLSEVLEPVAQPFRLIVTVEMAMLGDRRAVTMTESQPDTEMKVGGRKEVKLPGLPTVNQKVGAPEYLLRIPGKRTTKVQEFLEIRLESITVRLLVEEGMKDDQLERIKSIALATAGLEPTRGDTLEVQWLPKRTAETQIISAVPLIPWDVLLVACGTFLLSALALALAIARRGSAPSGRLVGEITTGAFAGQPDAAAPAAGEAEDQAAVARVERAGAFGFLAEALPSEQSEVLLALSPPDVALVLDLGVVGAEVGREVFAGLTPERRLEVAAALGRARVVAREDVARSAEAARAGLEEVRSRVRVGGEESLAQLLEAAPEEARESLLAELTLRHPDLAEATRRHMLVFEDLGKLPLEQIRKVVTSVDPSLTALALRDVAPELRETVLKAVSKRLRGILAAEDEAGKSQGTVDAEAARRTIEAAMRRVSSESPEAQG